MRIRIALTAVTVLLLSVLIPALSGTSPPKLPRAAQEAASWKPLPPIPWHIIPSSVPPTTTTVPPTTTTTTSRPAPVVSSPPVSPPTSPPVTSPPAVVSSGDAYAAWAHVATCEEGGFGNYGFPAYPNSLGIMASAWYAHGGGSDLSPDAQIAVAESLIDSLVGTYIQGTRVYPGFVPDESGCSSW
jgi:hypothetical protein